MHRFLLKVKNLFDNAMNKRWIWVYAFIVVSFAIFINIALIYLPIPTAKTLHTSDWLGFWGSYLGSILGCAVSIATLKQSQKTATRQHEEFQTQIEENRKESQKHYEENEKNRRLSVQPFITMDISPYLSQKETQMDPSDFSEFKYYFYLQDPTAKAFSPFTSKNIERISVFLRNSPDIRTYCITLSNIGLGPACCVDISAEIEDSDFTPQKYGFQSFASSQSKKFLMILSSNLSFPFSCFFTLTFSDIFKSNYQVSYRIKFDKDSFDFSPMMYFPNPIQTENE